MFGYPSPSSWMCWPAFSGNKVDALPEEQPDSLQRIEALVSDFMVGSVGFCRDDSILIFQ